MGQSSMSPPAIEVDGASGALEPARAPARPSPVVEFLLVGGATPFLFPLAWVLRRVVGIDDSDFALGFLTFYAAFVINDPHFAVTYCLFYRDFPARAFGAAYSPWQQARYVACGVVAPLALAAWAAAALAAKSAVALGFFIQLMFFLVGWHYVKQGFGVMVVLAARRGVRFGRGERWTLLAHCLAGWAYAWASPADPGTEVEEKGVVYTTLAHPVWLERVTHAVFLATACLLLVVLIQKRRREGRLPILTPLSALPGEHLVVVDLLEHRSARRLRDPGAPLGAVPLFRVAPSRQRGARARRAALVRDRRPDPARHPRRVRDSRLGWLLFHGAPTALDDLLVSRHRRLPDVDRGWALGATPYFAALYTFVNIHHFLMDSVIWRRDNPETRYLLVRD